ncbi:MAG TPA: inositol oxygenase family protein [Gemmataceae bacterium]|nr:inositol oxygenase family protein [Gemmataceae bacterium]
MTESSSTRKPIGPLQDLDEWEEALQKRYPEPPSPTKKPEEFRNYEADARPSVCEFYRLNHRHQCLDFVRDKKRQFLPLKERTMGIWEAMEFLNTLVDDSDPDTSLTQIDHLMQTAEAIRRDGHPRWFILTGLIHDLGKVLCLFGEPQWAVVGDTFPVGCAFSEKIVFHEFFAQNPDSQVAEYQTPCGIYEEGCGLDKVHLSWGHDEYLYQVVKDYLPDEALAMIRYHSFYPAHREGAYAHLMNQHDRKLFDSVRAFNPYDLYSKSAVRPDVELLTPFYQELIAEYFPPTLRW